MRVCARMHAGTRVRTHTHKDSCNQRPGSSSRSIISEVLVKSVLDAAE